MVIHVNTVFLAQLYCTHQFLHEKSWYGHDGTGGTGVTIKEMKEKFQEDFNKLTNHD